ncbi:MAG: TrkA C-terminal domain-containing protein [Bacilli bacterium]|nr:TrkA C-terminal domain-containing protein [Bacilli bacterium]
MNFWLSASLILIVLSLYLLVTTFFQVAFRLTGLSADRVKFQVASMFTGAGFTTQESELIATNQARRKLAVACMYTGHIFTALVIGLVMNLFFNLTKYEAPTQSLIFFYVTSAAFLFLLILKLPPISTHVQNRLGRIAEWILEKRNKRNVLTPLDVYGKSAVVEITLNQVPNALFDRPLKNIKLNKAYGINVLTIRRRNHVLSVTPDTILQKGDLIVVFGVYQNIKDLFGYSEIKNEDVEAMMKKTQNEIAVIDNYAEKAMCSISLNHIPSFLKDRQMKDTGLKEKYSINIVMLKRSGEALSVERDTILEKNDEIVCFGNYNLIKELFMGE